ncbi:MAG: ABC transporter ATP-binding protein [Promethearchaeota archaeon]
MQNQNILEIQDLVLRFYTYEGVVKALEKVNLSMKVGETLGIVGETGCGKSMTGFSTLVLTPSPGKIISGRILFKNERGTQDILSHNEATLRTIRGKDISMIFQEPRSALNPLFTVEEQIAEVIIHHRKAEFIRNTLETIEKDIEKLSSEAKIIRLQQRFKMAIYRFQRMTYRIMLKNHNSVRLRILSKIPLIWRFHNKLRLEIRKEIISILKEMKIPDPERIIKMYPHELSGGMQQRVVIAMGLVCNPKIMICDEPTTNLDVTIEAQILQLIRELKRKFNSSIIYITHDMGVVAEMCDRVCVMYAGNVVEITDVFELFKNPLHPYTKALLESIPKPGEDFKSIKGIVPNLITPPSGCRFHPRCSNASPKCSEEIPTTVVFKEHVVSCHLYSNQKENLN